jgi:glycosyltransferase involved in cell wall biosynthesis
MVESKLPKIGVVVTSYNCRDYIADAIRSVAAQTLPDFECVIVDDASTDGSADLIQRILDELADPRFRLLRLDTNVGQTGATRRGLALSTAPFVCFLDADDLWHETFLERHLAAHLNETYAVGFTACNARLIDGQGALIAGAVYWFGRDRARADRDRTFAALDPSRVPKIDPAKRQAEWQTQSPYRLYTKRVVHWVWVSTSSMMFRRSLIDLVFPDDDQAFRLHMDYYVVVMAQMVAGSLLIDEPLYSYRLHGRNGAADNPVLGGRLHLSARNWGDTHARMLDRMLATMLRDRERLVTALGERQYRRMLLRMRAARQPFWLAWTFVVASWLV